MEAGRGVEGSCVHVMMIVGGRGERKERKQAFPYPIKKTEMQSIHLSPPQKA